MNLFGKSCLLNAIKIGISSIKDSKYIINSFQEVKFLLKHSFWESATKTILSQYDLNYVDQDLKIEEWAIKYGFCINCCDKILYCRDRPLCKNCFFQFGKEEVYGRKEFKYCHRCGTDYGSLWRKPFCQECWQETRDSQKNIIKNSF